MKNLFEVATADEVKTRLGKLRTESERLWGKMTAPQMVAHCAISMRWAVGELVPFQRQAVAIGKPHRFLSLGTGYGNETDRNW